jgi:hypothetical protein
MKTMDAKVTEVAEALSLNPETVREFARAGKFPNAYKTGAGKINSPIRIPWADVTDFRLRQPRVFS